MILSRYLINLVFWTWKYHLIRKVWQWIWWSFLWSRIRLSDYGRWTCWLLNPYLNIPFVYTAFHYYCTWKQNTYKVKFILYFYSSSLTVAIYLDIFCFLLVILWKFLTQFDNILNYKKQMGRKFIFNRFE